MQSSFFTNDGENTLKNRINAILGKDKNIEYLDFLIGYFRITGFDKISDNLNNIKHTRILIGINTDKETYDASQLIKKFSEEQIDLYNEDLESLDKYKKFVSMLKLIVEKRIEIRISEDKNVHSKMYIMRDEGSQNHSNTGIEYQGRVIIGSSNLTHNGLEANTEINAELRDDKDLIDAVNVFDKLWSESVELTEDDFNKHLKPFIKPPVDIGTENITQDIYIKLLIEHFGSKIDYLNTDNIFVPKGFKQLSYQVEAVNDGIEKLSIHNGFFLSDVVGLGKTVVVAMLVKKLESSLKKKVLIVIPPAVETQWVDTFNEFEIVHYKTISLASLHKVNASEYGLIIVDESHKFKNKSSTRYKQLSNICQDKQVILLSATPQNNTPSDLLSQIALFQNVKNSTIPTCRNLLSFFDKKVKEYKDIIKSDTGIDTEALNNISVEIRDRVLRTIMIRRTRYDLEHHKMYEADIKAQKLSIPKVKAPEEHEYELKGKLASTFDETGKLIVNALNYARFNALAYLTEDARKKHYPNESDNIFDFNPLAGIMKILLVKRFESSFSAFKISIARHLKRYESFIKNYEKDTIYLGKKASDILDYDENIDGDYDDFIERLKEKGKVKELQKIDFKENFIDEVKADKVIFEKLVKLWRDKNEDPKLEKFLDVLKKEKLDRNLEKKVVIFTESVDTLKYLQSKLKTQKKILFITSQNREEKKKIIQENFDANYDVSKQKNDYNTLITTDTLAEGINLHRSNTVYNYDIPWNATKLIQRIGRVNRIGTHAEFIYIHNFKPASHIEKLIQLSQKALVKLQSSHTMIGEDNQIYSKEENVSSVNLFDEYEKEANERDEELDFLEELRDFREHHTEEFDRIRKITHALHTQHKDSEEHTYVMLDINRQKNYAYADNSTVKEVNFVEIAKALKSLSPKETLVNKDANKYLSEVIEYFEDRHKRDVQDSNEESIDDTLSQRAINYLKEWQKRGLIDKHLFKKYRATIEDGSLSSIYIDQLNSLHKSSDEEIGLKLTQIIENRQAKQSKLFDEEFIIHPILSEIAIKG